MTPAWMVAGRKVKRVVKSRYVPLLAMGAAYSFLVMMFNIPVPDGTTAHAVGAVLIAVLLGPWAAVIAVSVALLIQALLFGDGGVLAYGANALNMALVMPFVGYGAYKLTAGRCPLTACRRAVAAGVGGYAGLIAAALFAAVEFGIQPDLFHSANGTPLYAPFHLTQTIPAMLSAHMLVAGVVESALTYGVVAYLQRANVPILRINHDNVPDAAAVGPMRKELRWSWAIVGLGTMVTLAPLGLVAGGVAFGEDAPEDLDLHKYGLAVVPRGLAHYSRAWTHTIFGNYGFASGDHAGIGYVVSAIVGVIVIVVAVAVVVVLALLVRRMRTQRSLL